MKSRASARHAYLEAEVITGLAHQIRAIRIQRGWSQAALAKRLGTTQTVVSRLEDPSYGRYTLKTLIDLAKTFDTGMQVRFTSFVTMLQETYRPNAKDREVMAFTDEAPSVGFFKTPSLQGPSNYIRIPSGSYDAGIVYCNIPVSRQQSSAVTLVDLTQRVLK